MLHEWKPFQGGRIAGVVMADPPLARPSSNGLLVVDLGALRRNYRTLKNAVAPAACAAVVKADAYGLGLAPVVKALLAEDCSTFFVATLSEAKALKAVAPAAAVYAFNGLAPGAAPEFAAADVRPVLNSIEEAKDWADHNDRTFRQFPAAIHIDTGMNRLGLSATDAGRLSQASDIIGAFPVSLVMSHLACGDDPADPRNAVQRDAFAALSGLFRAEKKSLANSAGVFLGRGYHFSLARPGVALYGGRFSRTVAPLEPVVRLYARIAQIREAEKGETVGYGGAYTCTRRTRLATISAGYADGFKRLLGAEDGAGGWAVYVGDVRAPLVGRVSMDLLMADVTDVPEPLARRGALVEIIGEHVTLDDIAAAAGTIGYEMLTSLGARYERVYTES
ncbi:MAG: alanine racemase [Hyphomicrobiales bacterium]|nr:alanine racemase [Hyphomicrobiales bacterium]